MNILFHTIAIEPARWTPQRVAFPLEETASQIEQAGFYPLEIFEPHLAMSPNEETLRAVLQKHHLNCVTLSSYLNVSPATSEEQFLEAHRALAWRMRYYGFKKVRLFPGPQVKPDDTAAKEVVARRIRVIAEELPLVEVLLETHDGSIADDPQAICDLVEMIDRPNVGLLWQPTIFKADEALRQFEMQKEFIRHFHLQNRDESGKFTLLKRGVIPWEKILEETDYDIDVSIEFVPKGICPAINFHLSETLQEIVSEFDYLVQMQG